MTAFQRSERGRYIGPVWIGIHGAPREREYRIFIDANGIQHLTVDQARRLGEEALALADELQGRLGRHGEPDRPEVASSTFHRVVTSA